MGGRVGMRTIIIEDERPSARRLNRMVSALGLQVETMLYSVKETILWLSENEQPDLIFLDIQLSDGLSFEIFEEVKVTSAIIFTTAYDEYALKAFKLNSVDYLLKPIDEDELQQAVTKFKENYQKLSFDIGGIKKLFTNPNNEKNYKKRLTVKIGQRLKIVEMNNIECFFSENKATYIHTLENRNYLIDNSLDFWKNELNPTHFFRVNRSFIVNINAIKDMIAYSNSRLKLVLKSFNEQEIIVSRERVKEFKEWIL